MQTQRSGRRFDVGALTQNLSPVLVAMGAALLVILGILIIIFPPLLHWVVGIGLILAGVGTFTAVTTQR